METINPYQDTIIGPQKEYFKLCVKYRVQFNMFINIKFGGQSCLKTENYNLILKLKIVDKNILGQFLLVSNISGTNIKIYKKNATCIF